VLILLNKNIDQIEIYSIAGQEIIIENDAMQGNKMINLSGFEPGIYLISVKTGNRVYIPDE